MTDYAKKLRDLIVTYLRHETDHEQFDRRYYDLFLNRPAGAELSRDEEVFFSDVHEKLDLTHQEPSSQERKDGWIDQKQFREWLETSLPSSGV